MVFPFDKQLPKRAIRIAKLKNVIAGRELLSKSPDSRRKGVTKDEKINRHSSDAVHIIRLFRSGYGRSPYRRKYSLATASYIFGAS